MPVYKYNGTTYDIPEDVVSDFKKDMPEATLAYQVDGTVYDIPVSEKKGFLDTYPNASLYGEEVAQPAPSAREQLQAFYQENGAFLDDFEKRDSLDQQDTARNAMVNEGLSFFKPKSRVSDEERTRYKELAAQRKALEKAWYTSDEYLSQKNEGALELGQMRDDIHNAKKAYVNSQPQIKMSGLENAVMEGKTMGDYESQQFDIAARIMDKTIKLHNAPSKYDSNSGLKNMGIGAADKATDPALLSAGLTEITDNVGARVVLQKVQKELGNLNDLSEERIEKILSPAEKAVLRSWARYAQEQLDRQGDLSLGYQAGQGAVESLAFMAEFALTGGVGKAASEGAETLAKWLGKKWYGFKGLGDEAAEAVMKAAGEKTLGKYGKKLGLALAETAGRTLVMPSTYRNISEKATEIKEDKDDNRYLIGLNEAFIKGYADSFIENLSEGGRVNALGDLVGDIAGNIPAWKKMVNAFSNTKASELLKRLNSTGIMNTLRAGGWHGLGEEYLEEWYGNALRTITGVDKNALKNFVALDNQMVTLASFLPISIFGGTVSTGQVISAKRDLDKKAKALQSALMGSGYDEAQAKNMIDMMRAETPQGISNLITPLIRRVAGANENEARELAKPAMEFAWAVRRYQSYDTKYSYQQQEQRDNLKAEMETKLGKFWMEGEDGQQTVQRGVNEKGEVVYLLGKKDIEEAADGIGAEKEVAAIDAEGNHIFVFPSDYRLEEELPMNDFLGIEIMTQKRDSEAARMASERDAKFAEVKSRSRLGTQLNIGTNEAPVVATISKVDADGVVVETPEGFRKITYTELANKYADINPAVYTDAELDEQEADNISAERAQREAALDQEYENDDDAIEELAEAENEIEQSVEESTKLPLKDDGTVDQAALWNDSPARWAKWNDEQKQDGGADTLAYLNTAIKAQTAKIEQLVAAQEAETDFDRRDAIAAELSEARMRQGDLLALHGQYTAQVEAQAIQQQAAQPVQTESSVESKSDETHETNVRQTVIDLYNDAELSEEEIEEYIKANIRKSQSELDKHLSKAPKMGTDISQYKEKRAKHAERTAELEKQLRFWKGVHSYVEVPTTQFDMEPQNALEFAARELSIKDGIKLQPDSFKRHTDYGAEIGNFLSILRTKEKGGLTLEAAGERLMELDRENSTGFFDQSDPNAGLNAILDVLGGTRTSGDISGYIKANREQTAKEEVAAARNAMMEEVASEAQEFEPEEQTEEEAMKANAEIATEIELTPENWIAEFGEEIGDIPDDIWESSLDEDMPDFTNSASAYLPSEEMKQKFSTMRARINDWAQKLGVQVRIMETLDDVVNQSARGQILEGGKVYGYFDPATGEVAFYLPDFLSLHGRELTEKEFLSEIDKTYIHEVVAHRGLRGLLGEEKYGELCDMVWDAMTEQQKAKFLNYPGVNGNTRTAADEFIAHFAENVDYNGNRTLWDKIVDFIKDFFNSVELPTDISNESLAELLRHSYRNLAKSAASIDTNANQQAEGNTVFRAANGSLVGLHNISEDKLRKVLKQGGLANPSTAVVNISEYLLDGYGEISLIMPSSLVDANTGDNIGTYTGDAWTPTYPPISRKVDGKGWKVIKDLIRSVVSEDSPLYHDIINGLENYLEDNRSSKMEFVFLKEKGIEPEIAYKGADGFVGIRNLEAILGVQGLRDGLESYERYKNASPMAKRSFNMWLDAAGNKQAHKELKEQIKKEPRLAEVLKLNEDVSFAAFDSFTYDIFRKEQDAGKIDTYDTMSAAARYVDANNLRGEFEAWLESLMEQAGAKEVFFAGYTRDGERIYKDNTLENVSRHMRLQGRTNAYDDHGLSATKSALLQRMTSLSQIRKNKARLQNESAYNKEYDALKDRLWSVISQLADMQQISSNQFMNVDYAESRLQEAFTKKNPIAHLNKEYGYEIDPAGEYADEIKSFIKDVQQMPAKYFETKFERPVYLNEFAAAVMPTTTSEDIKQAVSEVGLPIFEYDSSVEGSRKEATLKATEGEGIRFRAIGEKGAANLDKAEEASIRLDNLAVARQMEKSGKDAKAIKLATGWERGVDKLWRYEVPDDFDLSELENRLQESLNDGLSKAWGIVYPSDLGELTKAYPDFNVDIMVWVGEEFENTGEYSPATEGDETTFGRSASIEVKAKTVADIKDVLVHEIQHVIQEKEGFAEGGSVFGLKDKLSSALDNRVARIKELRAEGRDAEADELMSMSKGLAEAVINNDADTYQNYRKLTGEVEARNVSARLGMSEQERRESLLFETEDVAREDQIVLMDGFNVNAKFIPSLLSLRKAVNKIKSWMANDIRNDSFEIPLPNRVLNKIRSVMGRDFDSHNITANGLAHALKNHGEGGKKLSATSIPIRKEDMELVPYIMTAPDRVEKGSTKNNRESVRFIKNISNGYVVVIEKEFDNSADDLETINMWAELSDVSNATRTPDSTSETPTIGRSDVAKIRKDAEDAILAEELNRKKVKSSENGDVRFRITPEQDKAYMDAVNAGDMETAQRMVIEAAKLAMPNTKVVDENGNPMVVYHGTGKEYGFTIFDTNPDNQNLGSHFGTAEAARVFDPKGNHTYEVFLNIRNPWSSSVEDFWTDDEETYAFVIAELADHLASQGNKEAAEIYNKTVAQYPMAKDSETWLKWFETGEGRTYKYMSNQHISLRRLLEIGGYDGWMYENFVEDAGSISWVALSPSQIKSAEPVTYDDNGNVIPLSERFNPEKEDIRFRMREEGESAMEFYQASLDDFLASYNPVAEIKLFPVNEETAKKFGYTLEELQETCGDYDKENDIISIFVHEDEEYQTDIRSTIFHESIHKNEYFFGGFKKIGKWMLGMAENNEVFAEYKEKVVNNYPESEHEEEMLCNMLGDIMAYGEAFNMLNIMPEDIQGACGDLLNQIGYDRTAEKDERVRRAMEEELDSSEAASAQRKASKGSWRKTEAKAALTAEERRIIGEYFPEFNKSEEEVMKAPNGKDSKLTKDQWNLVRSEEFIDWFGDWINDPENASKVVDSETGEPMVVYHGTAGTINEFQDQQRSPGFWFVDREDVANGYAESASAEFGEEKNVIPVFLNIRNPRIEDAHAEYPAEFALKSYVENDNGVYVEFDTYEQAEAYRKENVPDGWVGASKVGDQHDLVEWARERGNDGVIIKNVYDQAANAETGVSGTQTNYVVLRGNQIKLTSNENPTESSDIRFRTSLELDEEFGDAWRNQQNEDGRHSTQVANTKSTYEKIGHYLEDAGMKGASILDASSGLGLGTQALREMGFQVDDVEPFPSENREAPTFSSYADIDGKYDVVISNAVLNVIPDDWRADVLHQMADAVKEGGKMIINTRPASNIAQQGVEGKTRITLDSPSEILVKRGDRIAAYQKGFTSEELAEWIKSELGEGWRVEKATKKNSGISGEGTAVVIKDGDNVSFRTTGTPTDEVVANGLNLTPSQTSEMAANIFAALPEESRKKITDGLNGNILGLKDAILQIPASLASKENWNDEDRAMTDIVAEEMTKMAGEMTRPFSAPEALWLLYNNLNKSTDLVSLAQRSLVQRNLGFDAQTLATENEAKESLRFRQVGDARINATASLYNKGAVNAMTRLKESFVDMNASVEELVKAIEERTGKKAEGFENILWALNQQSSRGLAAMKDYERRFLNPMYDAIRNIMDKGGFKYEDVVRYVILKHGLERNKKLAQRDAKAHYQEIYDEIIEKINSMDDRQKRTYLTNAQLKEADAKAKLATLQAKDTSTLTEDEMKDHKKELAVARKEVKEAEEYRERAEKIRNMSEQEAKDELDEIFEKIENGADSIYKELRESDYSGLTSMFYDQLGVDRNLFATEEAYQSALMAAKKDKYSSLEEVEAAAEAEVKKFEGAVDTKELWKRVNAATKETLRQQYEANMISKDQYESLRDMFEYYVPLRGFKDNTAEDMYTYYRKPNSTGYTKPILGAEGRKTEAESPFGWIASMAGSAIASNVKNEAKLALFYFVSNRPENGIATISKTWYVHTPGDVDERGKKIFKPVYPPFSEDLSSDAAKAQYEQWQDDMRKLKEQGLAYEAGQRLNLGNAVVNISDANKPEHIVAVKVGGKEYTIVINGNPRAAQAINGELNLEGTADDYSALFGPVLRWMSSVNTSYNPEFWITNMMRDMAFTWMAVNTKGADDKEYRKKFGKNWLKAWKVVSLVAKNEKGTLGNSPIEQAYKDFVENGGVTGYTQIKDNETWEKEIEEYLKSNDPESLKSGKMMRGMKTVFHAAHRFGESLEQVSRFAAFLTAQEMGKSINEAVNEAKEITVNFNRKGSGKMISLEEAKHLTNKNGRPIGKLKQWMVVGLSSIAPLGRRFIMFFNAAIQGLNATYKLWKANPKRFKGWVMGYFAVGAMNAILHAMMDDDDDYLDMPQYERRNALMIGGNGAYLKWALPQEARAFYALGDIVVESMLGRNPQKFWQKGGEVGQILTTVGEVLPINPTEGWRAVAPSIAIPALELMINEDYKGEAIYNESKWLSKEEASRTAKWNTAKSGTGWTHVKIAQGLNFLTGGDKYDAGLINIRPEAIEHIVQSAFGGTIRTADKFITTISAAIDPEEEWTVKQTPFLNRVLTLNDERYRNVHVNEVFDYYAAEAEHTKTLEKKYRKDGDSDALLDLTSSDEYQWMMIYENYKKPLENVRERLKVAEGTRERKQIMREQDELKKMMIKQISNL